MTDTLVPLRRHADFLRLWAGETASLVGSQVSLLAVPLIAITSFGATPGQLGMLRFVQLAPYVCLSLLFGTLIDRTRHRPVLMGANAMRLVLIAAIPVLAWAGVLDLPLLLLIACCVGVASVLFDVTWMSYVTVVVADRRLLLEANQKLGVTAATADVAGPGLAGALVSVLGAVGALVVDVGSYAVSLAALATIRVREERPQPDRPRRRVLPELAEGVRFVFRHPLLRPLALVGFLCNFSLVAVWTLALLHGARTLGLHPAVLGAVFSAASIGTLVGAGASRRLVERAPLGRVYVWAMSAVFAGPLLIPFVGTGVFAVVCFGAGMMVSYLGLGVANVVVVTLRQTQTPAPLMGRMNAAFRTLLFGGGAIGGLVAGLVGDAIGPTPALMVIAASSAACIVAVIVSPVRHARSLEDGVAPASARGK